MFSGIYSGFRVKKKEAGIANLSCKNSPSYRGREGPLGEFLSGGGLEAASGNSRVMGQLTTAEKDPRFIKYSARVFVVTQA